jgi:AcrR family transcriptional regulator
MSTTPGRRARGRPALSEHDQRRRLVEAAWRVFEQESEERVTVADIVREAGMSSRSFYQHFSSKEDLIAHLVEEVGGEILRAIEADFETPLADPVAQTARALGTFLELLPSVAIDLTRLEGTIGGRVVRLRQRVVRALTDVVHAHLVKLHAAGEAPRRPERAEVEVLVGGIAELGIRCYSEGRRQELLALQPILVRLLVRALS